MNFANDVSQIINDAPKEPTTFVESGLTATKQFFETTDQLIKIQGGKSSGLEHLVKFNNTALLGVQAWKSHTDPTSSSYRKIMDSLLLGANAIESILGLFGQADHIRQIAGVASVGLKFTDKILTLTVGDEINEYNSLAWAGRCP